MLLAPTDLWGILVFGTFATLCALTAWAIVQATRAQRMAAERVTREAERARFEHVAPRARPQPSQRAPQLLVVDGANPEAPWRMEGLARIAHEWRN